MSFTTRMTSESCFFSAFGSMMLEIEAIKSQNSRAANAGSSLTFDLAHIQRIVDQPQQIFARLVNLLKIVRFFAVIPALHPQIGHPDDRVHGCAQIDAHAAKNSDFARCPESAGGFLFLSAPLQTAAERRRKPQIKRPR